PIYFFFNAPPTTEIYTLSLHDALPIFVALAAYHTPDRRTGRRALGILCFSSAVAAVYGIVFFVAHGASFHARARGPVGHYMTFADRKSTRLNSSHSQISYAVFCLKKKK